MDESTTKKLADILSGITDEKEMERFMDQPKITDFFNSPIDYFRSLPSVKSMSDSEMIEASGIEKSYYYQIMKETRKPSRDKVLRLCIGAKLSYRETERMLELCGFATLYSKNRRDIIISVALNQHISVIETNILLDKYEEEIIS